MFTYTYWLNLSKAYIDNRSRHLHSCQIMEWTITPIPELNWWTKGVDETHISPCWSVLDFWKINLEKSSWQTWFLAYFELDFYFLCSLQKSISKLIFAGYTGSRNQVWNRLKIQLVKVDFSKLIFQKSSTDQQGNRLTCLLSVCFR